MEQEILPSHFKRDSARKETGMNLLLDGEVRHFIAAICKILKSFLTETRLNGKYRHYF